MCLLNFGPLFLAAVFLVVEARVSHLSLLKDDLPLVNAGLCCPLGVEGKRRIWKVPSAMEGGLYVVNNIYLYHYLHLTSKYSLFSFSHNDGLFWLRVKVVVWVFSVSSQPGVWCVCVADLIPLVLLILGLRIRCVSIKPALCFVCWTPICLLSSTSKQSCLQVVH